MRHPRLQNTYHSEETKRKLFCSICKKEFNMALKDLPTNFSVLQNQGSYEQYQLSFHLGHKFCFFHNDNINRPAKFLCSKCKAYMCEDCHSTHISNYVCSQVQDNKKTPKQVAQEQNSLRQQNANNILQEGVQNQEHEIVQINEVANYINGEVRQILVAQDNHKKNLQQDLMNLSDVSHHLDIQHNQTRTQIQRYYADLTQRIQELQEQQLRQIDREHTVARHKIEDLYTKISNEEGQTQQNLNKCKKIVNEFIHDNLNEILLDGITQNFHLKRLKGAASKFKPKDNIPRIEQIQDQLIKAIDQRAQVNSDMPNIEEFIEFFRMRAEFHDKEETLTQLISRIINQSRENSQKPSQNQNSAKKRVEESKIDNGKKSQVKKRDQKKAEKANKSKNNTEKKSTTKKQRVQAQIASTIAETNLNEGHVSQMMTRSKIKISNQEALSPEQNLGKRLRSTKKRNHQEEEVKVPREEESLQQIVQQIQNQNEEEQNLIEEVFQGGNNEMIPEDYPRTRLIEDDHFKKDQLDDQVFENQNLSTQATINYQNMMPREQNNESFSTPKRSTRPNMSTNDKKFCSKSNSRNNQSANQNMFSRGPVNISKNLINAPNPYDDKSEVPAAQEMIQPNQQQIQQLRLAERVQNQVQQMTQTRENTTVQTRSCSKRSVSQALNSQQNIQSQVSVMNMSQEVALRDVVRQPQDPSSQQQQNQPQLIFRGKQIHVVLPSDQKILVLDPAKMNGNPWSCINWNTNINFSRCRSPINTDSASCMFPDSKNRMLITGGGGSNTTLILEYNPATNRSSIQNLSISMNQIRNNHQLVFCNNSFYAIGGDIGNQILQTCESLNYIQGTFQVWKQGPLMKVKRTQFGTAVIDNSKILALGSGGQNYVFCSKSAEVLSTQTNKWDFFPNIGLNTLYSSISLIKLSNQSQDREELLIFGTPLNRNLNNAQPLTRMMKLSIQKTTNFIHQIEANEKQPVYLNESRQVRNNIFLVNNQLIVLGGNWKCTAEYLDLQQPQNGFTQMRSYNHISLNALVRQPSGLFHTY